jgi:hypothetical protein
MKNRTMNRAALIYMMIGGTAHNQALAIQMGWEPDRKPRGPVNPAGTKIGRLASLGRCTVRHPSAVDAHFLAAKKAA